MNQWKTGNGGDVMLILECMEGYVWRGQSVVGFSRWRLVW